MIPLELQILEDYDISKLGKFDLVYDTFDIDALPYDDNEKLDEELTQTFQTQSIDPYIKGLEGETLAPKEGVLKEDVVFSKIQDEREAVAAVERFKQEEKDRQKAMELQQELIEINLDRVFDKIKLAVGVGKSIIGILKKILFETKNLSEDEEEKIGLSFKETIKKETLYFCREALKAKTGHHILKLAANLFEKIRERTANEIKASETKTPIPSTKISTLKNIKRICDKILFKLIPLITKIENKIIRKYASPTKSSEIKAKTEPEPEPILEDEGIQTYKASEIPVEEKEAPKNKPSWAKPTAIDYISITSDDFDPMAMGEDLEPEGVQHFLEKVDSVEEEPDEVDPSKPSIL